MVTNRSVRISLGNVGVCYVLLSFSALPGRAQAQDSVLASERAGGWLNVDFIYSQDALAEARECVRRHREEEAVACYAFASSDDYWASKPSAAGTFEAICYDARWLRNKLGDQSGGSATYRSSECPGRQQTLPEPDVMAATGDSVEVAIDIGYEVESEGLFIVGSTNLPDGTVLSTSVSASSSAFLAQSKGTVTRGKFRVGPFRFRGSAFPPGEYELGVTVPFFNTQPQSVRSVLGDHLELMAGPLVRWMAAKSLGKVASKEVVIRL